MQVRGAVQLSCYILILGKIPVANTDLVIIFLFILFMY